MNQLPFYGASFSYANALQSFQFGSPVGSSFGCGQAPSSVGFNVQSQLSFYYSLMQAQQSMNQGWQSFCGCNQGAPNSGGQWGNSGPFPGGGYHNHNHNHGPSNSNSGPSGSNGHSGHNHGPHGHSHHNQGKISKFCSPWGKRHHNHNHDHNPTTPEPQSPQPQQPQAPVSSAPKPTPPLVQQAPAPLPPVKTTPAPLPPVRAVSVGPVPSFVANSPQAHQAVSPFTLNPGRAVFWVGGAGFPVL